MAANWGTITSLHSVVINQNSEQGGSSVSLNLTCHRKLNSSKTN